MMKETSKERNPGIQESQRLFETSTHMARIVLLTKLQNRLESRFLIDI